MVLLFIHQNLIHQWFPLTNITNTTHLFCQSNTSATAAAVGTITANGTAAASRFTPFNTDINTVRGQETGYATLNPLKVSDNSSIVLSDGNLRVDITGNYYNAVSTLGMSSGKFYCETSPVRGYSYFGIATGVVVPNTWGGDQTNNSAWVLHGNGSIYHNNATTNGTGFPSTSGVAGGYTLGLLFDADNKTMRYVYKGAISKIYNMANTVDGDSFYFFVGGDAGSYEIDVNFGQKPFKFPPPDGFQPLNAATVRPVKVISRSDQYVGIVTYTGDATSSRKISGYNFAPDLVWAKQINGTRSNILFDTVRGVQEPIYSDTTDNQVTASTSLLSFNNDGFTVGTDYHLNQSSSYNYVAWCWKAGGNKNTFNIDNVGYSTSADVNMSVGSLNSAVYDDSIVWSSNYTGTAQPTQAFDGTGPKKDGYAHQSGGLTITFPGAGLSGRIIVYGGTGGGGADTYTLSDGSSLSSAVQYDTSPYYEALDFGVKSNITSLVCSAGYTLYGIKVDGKLLVDNGVTPSNAPSIAPTGCICRNKTRF